MIVLEDALFVIWFSKLYVRWLNPRWACMLINYRSLITVEAIASPCSQLIGAALSALRGVSEGFMAALGAAGSFYWSGGNATVVE